MILDELKLNGAPMGIRAFQTQRGNVVTGNAYSQWNLCDYTGDDALRVLNARMELCRQLGIDLDHLVMPRQTHGTELRVIGHEFMSDSVENQDSTLEGVDALVCTTAGVCIGVNTADCVPLVMAAPRQRVVAVAHAGWRGTVAGIAATTVEAMCRQGAEASHIVVAMGVSICQECFEVGDEVVAQFEKAGFDMSLIMRRNSLSGKAHINLQEANRQVLMAAGVGRDNIALPQHCSRCEHERYFSARRLTVKSGRTFTGIIMSPEF